MKLTSKQAALLFLSAALVGSCADDGAGTEPCPPGTVRAGDRCLPAQDAGDDTGVDADAGLDVGPDAEDVGPDEADTGGEIALPFAVDEVGYVPSGYFGDGETPGAITMDNACPMRAGDERGRCHRATWTPGIGSDGFAGVFWQYPANNWGDEPGLALPSGATEVSFQAWGDSGGEVVTFLAGLGADVDGFARDSGPITLTTTPTEVTIDLCFADYDEVVSAFGWSAADATAPVVFHVDDVVWRVGEEECEEEELMVPFSVDEAGYVPSGYFGDGERPGAVTMDNACPERAGDETGDCHHVEWEPSDRTADFAGVWWQFPADNWGDDPGLALPQGATDVSFYAWGETGGEVVSFLAGLDLEVDGFQRGSGEIVLTTEPTQYTISLCGVAYSEVVGAFGWLAADATETVAFNIDDIQWTASEDRCQGDLPLVIVDDVGYVPSGLFPESEAAAIGVSEICADPRPGDGLGRCHQFDWAPSGADGFAGVYWQYPPNNWGGDDGEAGLALPDGATEVAFDAWGESGGEVVTFLAGLGADVDGFGLESEETLTATPTEYVIDLCGVEYDEVVSAFGWVAAEAVTFSVDNIVWREAEDACPEAEVGLVFDDDFGPGVQFVGFGDGAINDLSIDTGEANTGTVSLRFEVPATWFAGGAFALDAPADLSGFDALVFWAKASHDSTLDVAGVGVNSRTTPTHQAAWNGIRLSTEWAQYVIPIPDPAKLTAEDGLFYLAEGSDELGAYTIWLDDIRYASLGDTVIGTPEPVIATAAVDLTVGGTATVGGTQVTFPITYDGQTFDQLLTTSPRYFTFASDNAATATVSDDGTVTALALGTAEITAELGDVDAAGSLTVNVVGASMAAPEPPTRDPADVISLFSDVYTDVTVDTWSADWDQADVVDTTIGSDNVKRYTNLGFAGIEFTSATIDATGMTHLHLDVWTPVGGELRVKLVDFGSDDAPGACSVVPPPICGGDDSEHEVTVSTLLAGAWNSIEIELSEFTGLASREHLAQMILSGLANFYVDNIYFYAISGGCTDPNATNYDPAAAVDDGSCVYPSEPATAAPTPTTPGADVIAVFSDPYDPIPGVNVNPDWGQATVFTQPDIAGNATLKYAGLNYQGIELGANVDVTGLDTFHLDFWTPDASAVSIFLISPGPAETPFELPIARGTWVSVDVPLAHFSAVDLANVFQLKLEDFSPGQGSTIFIDNIYFYRRPAGADILSLTFDDAASIAGWTRVADADSAEASIDWAGGDGNPGGAIQLSAENTADTGRAYIFQYLASGLDYAGATGVTLTFDAKLAEPLNGVAVQLQTEIPGAGVVDNSNLEADGLNETTWTSYAFDFTGVNPGGDTFRMHFNLAAGAFVGAGGTLLVDNIRLSPITGVLGCTDADAANFDSEAEVDDGSCTYDVTFNVDMNCSGLESFSSVHVTGPFCLWCGNGFDLQDSDGDGIWTGTFAFQPGPLEYKFIVDGFDGQEELVDDMVGGGSCAPLTDYSSYANRQLTVGDAPLSVDAVYGSCEACPEGCTDDDAANYDPAATYDDGSCVYDVTFNLHGGCAEFGGGEDVRLIGSFCPFCADLALEGPDGDDVWSLTLPLAPGTYEYKYMLGAFLEQEELLDDMWAGGSCAPVTDLFTYANRQLTVVDAPVQRYDSYGSCDPCGDPGCTDDDAANYDPFAASDDGSCIYDVTFNVDMSCAGVEGGFSSVHITGLFCGWCGGGFDLEDTDADGIWTGTFAFEPGTLEYKYIVDGFDGQEELVDDMVAGGSCAPVTDYSSYANRQLTIVDAPLSVDQTYGSCDECPDLDQIDLPITFDDPTVDYTLTDFGGAATTLVEDPDDSSNTVASTNKPPGAELWAGTTMSRAAGLATAIPFTESATTLSVRVYSPDAGIPVRLKVEDALEPTHSVETEATTTLVETWETLVFDFDNEVEGTSALNLAYTYDKVSIFFNFGTTGTDAGDKTYLWDDVQFGSGL